VGIFARNFPTWFVLSPTEFTPMVGGASPCSAADASCCCGILTSRSKMNGRRMTGSLSKFVLVPA
jgi:hypothetical protein